MALPQLDYWSVGYLDGGFMQPAEQRAQTYLALVHGARSVIYFVLPFRHQASVETQKDISSEIRRLTPALLSREPRQEVTFEPESACTVFPLGNIGIRGRTQDVKFPKVQVSLRNNPAGGQLLLAVNPSRQGAHVRFTVSCLTPQSRVRDLIGRRQEYAVEQGAFSDTMEPMATRAYLLTRTRTPMLEPVRIHLTLSGPAVEGAKEPTKTETEPTKNLVSNSSFEEARMPGHPVHWEARTWQWLIPDRRAHGQDERDPFHGQFCFRVTRLFPDETRALHQPIAIRKDGAHTESMYLRADKPRTKAMLYMKAPYKKVEVGTNWKRYSMTRDLTRKGRTYVGVYHLDSVGSGNLYVDAVQLEEGTEATAYEAR